MKTILRLSASAMLVAALSCAATSAQAQTYTLTNETFESVAAGSLAAPLFSAVPVTVGYGQLNVNPANPSQSFWEIVPDFPITVENNNGNRVLGDAQGPVLFLLGENVTFTSFSANAVATGSPFATTTATGYFQSLTGAQLGSFTFNQTATTPLTLSVPAGTNAIILPSDSQYDNVSFVAVTVPETDTLALALAGAAAGALVLRRKLAK